MENKYKLWLYLMRIGKITGCHQKPERSFFFKGYQFPVCARCTGILAGYLLSIFLCRAFQYPYWFYGILILPMAIDGTTQYMSLRESNQVLRFVTGILGGFGLLSIQIHIVLNYIE